ncbi:MAG TPA: enolase C-terminal domain-like protein, partial [Chthoniobacterales bacterium]|nr:enolase C-terminal domain-like protein [Chthoniobacterales bacterium]
MELTFRRYDLQLAHKWMIASNQATGGKWVHPTVLVELRDADGTVGYGESSPSTRYDESVDTALEFLHRVEAARLSFDDLENSMRYIEALTPGNYSPKGALNLALLDGAAKRAHESVHELLGLPFDEGQHITSITIGMDEPEIMRQKTHDAAEFPILKLKVGAPNDAANLAAVRDAAPGKTIRVDANEAWPDKEHALRRIEEIARDPHIEFVEQPLHADTPAADFAWLKQRSPLPILADESYINAGDAERCAECFHGVNVKLAKTGGISRAYEALRAARALGLKTMIGC